MPGAQKSFDFPRAIAELAIGHLRRGRSADLADRFEVVVEAVNERLGELAAVGVARQASPVAQPAAGDERAAPQHNRYRKLVSRAFTPGMVAGLEPRIRAIACESLDVLRNRPEPRTLAPVHRGALPQPEGQMPKPSTGRWHALTHALNHARRRSRSDAKSTMRTGDLILVSVDDHVIEPPDVFERRACRPDQPVTMGDTFNQLTAALEG